MAKVFSFPKSYTDAMSLEDDLLAWYQENRRHMPWREDPLPYHVYLSEIMLQQTQVDTVRAYYLRFLKRFPTLSDLAQASEDEVLKLWEGLGYYSRGRNLLKAAQAIVASYGGEVPSDKAALLALPGIGEYTSRAIRAIAFHQKEIAVDGNLVRVYARLEEDHEARPEVLKDRCEDYFRKALKKQDPSFFNQALMDLGEMVCLPKALPLCAGCPLRAYCQSAHDGTMLDFPTPKKAKEKRVEQWTVLLLETPEEVALYKRPDKGLLASLYAFPMLEGSLSEEAVASWLKEQGVLLQAIKPLAPYEHVFSHLIWEMRGYQVILAEKPAKSPWIWVTKKELKRGYPLPSAFAPLKKTLF
jgi:A/G-specific adenine glycosylase